MMQGMLLTAGICMVLSLAHASLYWNCRRAGQNCHNNGICNKATGDCTCTSSYQGHDCTVPRPASSCTRSLDNLCLNGATCSGTTCYCTPEWTGETCATPTVQSSCSGGENLSMSVRPAGNFVGAIRIHDHVTTECMFTNDGDGLYSLTVPLDPTSGGCGKAQTGEDAEGPYRAFKAEVNFFSPLVTYVDYALEFRCYLPNDNSTITLTFGPLAVGEPTPSIVLEDPITGTALVVEPVEATPITEPVEVGKIYLFKFFISVGTRYKDIFLRKMVVYNPDQGNETVFDEDSGYEMVREGCALKYPTAGEQFMKGLSKNGTLIEVLVSMIKFTSTDKLVFDMRVRVCAIKCNDADCTDDEVYVSGPGYHPVGRRRRRRQTVPDEGDTEEVFFRVNVTIGKPLNPDINNDGAVDDKDIVTTPSSGDGDGPHRKGVSWKIAVPLALIAVGSLNGFVCVLYFCLRRNRKIHRDSSSEDSLMGYTASVSDRIYATSINSQVYFTSLNSQTGEPLRRFSSAKIFS